MTAMIANMRSFRTCVKHEDDLLNAVFFTVYLWDVKMNIQIFSGLKIYNRYLVINILKGLYLRKLSPFY